MKLKICNCTKDFYRTFLFSPGKLIAFYANISYYHKVNVSNNLFSSLLETEFANPHLPP